MSPSPECPLIEQRLPRLLEDDLPVGERALVLAHVRSCASCAAAHVRFVAVRDAVRDDARSDVDDFVALRARVASAIESRSRAPRVTRRGVLAAAAVITLAVGSVFVVPSAIEHTTLSGVLAHVRAGLPDVNVDVPIPNLSDLGAVR